MIEVIAPGLYTSVQDRGRPGFYAMGMPPSGAMDLFSHDAANLLVGNLRDAASLEITFVGPTLLFHADATIAVTGAEIDVTVDGQEIPTWTSVPVTTGQTLQFGMMRAGARAYLALRGGVDVPEVMGSRSTYVLSAIGGLHGRTLVAGDSLSIMDLAQGQSHPRAGVTVPSELRPVHSAEQELRIVGGLCDHRLTPEASEVLCSTAFEVSVEANRTGYRFSGPPLTFVEREPPFGAGADPSNVVNLGYPIGSIQAPSGSELICLLRDAVTGGGYATIGTVISVDLDVIAQMKLPDRARFRRVSLDDALAERRVRAERLARVEELATA